MAEAPKTEAPASIEASRAPPTAARFSMVLPHVAPEQAEAKPVRAPLPKGVLDKRLAIELEKQRRAEMRRAILQSKVRSELVSCSLNI